MKIRVKLPFITADIPQQDIAAIERVVMMDMRKRPRKNTPHHIQALDGESGRAIGRIVDITCDGMMVVAGKPLTPGHRLTVRINLPGMVQNRSEMVLQAETVWCNQDQNPRFFRIGFKFCNVSGEEGYLLEDVLHRFSLVG